MFDTKSDYALNKRGKSAIVCSSATGAHIRLTREDFASEEAFKRWKSWSDQDTVSPFVVALRSEIKSPSIASLMCRMAKEKAPVWRTSISNVHQQSSFLRCGPQGCAGAVGTLGCQHGHEHLRPRHQGGEAFQCKASGQGSAQRLTVFPLSFLAREKGR